MGGGGLGFVAMGMGALKGGKGVGFGGGWGGFVGVGGFFLGFFVFGLSHFLSLLPAPLSRFFSFCFYGGWLHPPVERLLRGG